MPFVVLDVVKGSVKLPDIQLVADWALTDDWHAMVDSMMIDPAYDGQLFKIALADVPERKETLVGGSYELPAPDGPTIVAVKITNILG